MLHDGRGGYCFEQNLLLKHVLDALGFRATGLAAHVLWDAPQGAVTPRSHMLLRLEGTIEQATPHEPFRLIKAHDEFIEVKIRGACVSLYRFGLHENLLPDYEVTNWYLSNHPDSRFVIGFLVARPAPDCRHALRNNQLAVHHLNGGTERRVLTSVAEMRATLETDFRLALPDVPELDAILARLTAQAS